MRFLHITVCIFGLSFINSQVAKPFWQPQYLGSTPLKHAAFLTIFQTENTNLTYEERWTMYVTTFDPLAVGFYDDVWYMRSPGSHLDNITDWADNYLLKLDRSAYWPNNPQYMPSEVVGIEGIVQPSGFLVTGKKDGQLQMYDTNTEPPTPSGGINIAANDSNEWSYHKIIWQDMDVDGDLDAVTARFHVNTVGGVQTEFLYFENPDMGLEPEWTEHVIATAGPDISFAAMTRNASGVEYDCFITAEFFAERMSVYYAKTNSDWSDVTKIHHIIIEPNAGQIFEVVLEDVNRDGKDDLIVTTYDTETFDGSVKVYQIPDDFRTTPWEYTVIADGFQPHNATAGATMSPGTPIPYYPTREYELDTAADGLPHKPFILLSGDDDGRIYILDPQSDDRNDWNYTKNILVDREDDDDTSGTMFPVDLDGDGYTEIVAAAYTVGQINAFTYSP